MRKFTKSLALSLTAYAAGDAVGVPVALGQVNGTLRSLSLMDNANQGAAGQIIFFDGDPVAAGGTFTDNGAAVIPAAVMAKALAVIDVPAYKTVAAKKLATAANIGIGLHSNALYAVFVTSGTPTYGAATDATLQLAIEDKGEA